MTTMRVCLAFALCPNAVAGFRLLRFEDADGVPEWDPQTTSLVRMISQKWP